MSEEWNVQDRSGAEGPDSALERRLIKEYLLEKGYRWSDLRAMPEEERRALMREACMYAATQLANIEARSKFRQKIRLP